MGDYPAVPSVRGNAGGKDDRTGQPDKGAVCRFKTVGAAALPHRAYGKADTDYGWSG